MLFKKTSVYIWIKDTHLWLEFNAVRYSGPTSTLNQSQKNLYTFLFSNCALTMFLESDPRTLFVGNLELNTTEEELRSKLLVTSGAWDIPKIVVCVGDEKTAKKGPLLAENWR